MIADLTSLFGAGANPQLPPDPLIELGLNCPANGQPPNFDAGRLTGYLNNRDEVLQSLITAQNAQELVTITGTGLARYGGDLTANRVIDVPIATQAEAQAGLDNTKALTPASIKPIIDAIYSDIGGLPPEVLDSFKEFANAINNDPIFANTVAAQIANEITARVAGDNALQNNLNNEATTRANGDTAETNARIAADNAEAAARAAADNAMLNLFNTMQAQMTAMQNQINQLLALPGEVSP